MKQYRVSSGRRFPFGATSDALGTNFSIWGLRSTGAELLLCEGARSREPFQVVRLGPAEHCTYYSWPRYGEGLPPGIHYAWRLDGPDDTRKTGFRFDRQKVL